jgi:hypothetical protein
MTRSTLLSRCVPVARRWRSTLSHWLRAGSFPREAPTGSPKFRPGLESFEDRSSPNDPLGLGATPLFATGLSALSPLGFSAGPLYSSDVTTPALHRAADTFTGKEPAGTGIATMIPPDDEQVAAPASHPGTGESHDAASESAGIPGADVWLANGPLGFDPLQDDSLWPLGAELMSVPAVPHTASPAASPAATGQAPAAGEAAGAALATRSDAPAVPDVGTTPPTAPAFNLGFFSGQGSGNVGSMSPQPPPPTPTVQFVSATFNGFELYGLASISVNLSTATNHVVTVNYQTSDGSGIAGVDYTTTSGTLTFQPGQTFNTFGVPILDDHLGGESSPETVNLTLSNPSGATLGSPSSAVLDIMEDTNNPVWSGSPSFSFGQTLPLPPVFTQTPSQSSAEAASPTLQVQASDPNGASLTYGAVNLPPGLVMSSSGAVSGTIDYAAAEESGGSYGVTVVAVDSLGASASESFTWSVSDTDRAPTLSNPGSQTDAEEDGPWVQLAASDVDGDPLTYSATNLPPGATIDPDTGLISGMIADTAAAGSPYNTTVTVSDGTLTASQSFSWSVTNGPPSVTYPGNQTNAQGDTVSLQISASDPHNATLSYGATGLPPGLAIDSASGLISGTISSTAASGSPYAVTVSASNGTLSASKDFVWTVTHVRVVNPGAQTNATGDTVSLPIQAVDHDGDSLTYSATGLPPGLSINGSTGVITGTVSGSASGTPYTTTVTASDGANSDSQNFTWTITHAADQGPTLTNPGNQSNNEDDKVALELAATDPEGDPLTYSATGLPPGLSIDAPSGVIYGTPEDSAVMGSPYSVTVTASDGQASDSQTFTWTVTGPSLTATAATVTATEGTKLQNATVATFTNANVGNQEDFADYTATIDWGDGTPLDTGVITGTAGSYTVLGTHTYADAGTYTVHVTASDEYLATATVNSTATVGDVGITATGVPVVELRGSTAPVPVATFTDTNQLDFMPYVAVINWGDGSSTTTTYTSALNGQGIVYGSHGYYQHGSYAITVTVMDGSTVLATASSTATVGDIYYGLATSLSVASFTDSSMGAEASDYTATINWGDGGSSPGVVSGSNGVFMVTSLPITHTYAWPGQYSVSVTVVGKEGGSPTTATYTVWVIPRPLSLYTAPVYATTDTPTDPNAPIALVVEPNPGGGPAGSPTISWGDGTSSTGSLSGGGGLFALTGSHTYTVDVGTYAVSATLAFNPAQVIPLVTPAQVKAKKDVKVDPKADEKDGAMGKLKWSITAPNPLGKGVTAKFSFEPTAKNPGTTIVFLQCNLLSVVGATPRYADPAEWYEKLSTDKTKGNQIDVTKGETDPYYGAMWNKKWVPEAAYPKGIGAGAPKKAIAEVGDKPNEPLARAGKGIYKETYETAAFCIDTQQILGVITWGDEIPDNAKDPTVIKYSTAGDFSLNASKDFKALVAKANGDDKKDPKGVNGVMEHAQLDGSPKVSKPKTDKMDLKGTSALS